MKLKGMHHPQKQKLVGVRTIQDLNLIPQVLDKARLKKCSHLSQILERLVYTGERPHLLIGQGNWSVINRRATKKGKKGQPVASLTQLAWVLDGSDNRESPTEKTTMCAHLIAPEENLDRLIKEHFDIDLLGVQPRRPRTESEGKALKTLESTTRRMEDGRFETGLLWRNKDEPTPDNLKSRTVDPRPQQN
ncbi:unnamed protein product [Danaus chrysippus]|uniref:(African queen) hypothetical protein n=1 Tax=Danaus chrysippus TaxID=151541 RepID=A0A8J2QY39_9NEOP|nr:unnamed protein product [Danaus chrysippus]